MGKRAAKGRKKILRSRGSEEAYADGSTRSRGLSGYVPSWLRVSIARLNFEGGERREKLNLPTSS